MAARRHLVSHRLVAVFLLGCLLFNYPLVAIFERFGLMGGVPSLFLWLMGAWLGLIVLMAVVVERSEGRER